MSESVVIGNATLYPGDCLDVMRAMDAESLDSIVCDPPYGLSFMGRNWDHGIPGVAFWAEALRVAKPGAHLLAFGGTRTFHRLAVAIEDAGWEIRDTLMWVYGSGFPKSLDVSKAIDKAQRAERLVGGPSKHHSQARKATNTGRAMNALYRGHNDGKYETAPATDAAREWHGYGTGLKPAWEPITVARKPLDGTVAENVLKHGCGGLNIDGCRIPLGNQETPEDFRRVDPEGARRTVNTFAQDKWTQEQFIRRTERGHDNGRFPANLIHDGSPEVVALFPETQSGLLKAGTKRTQGGGYSGKFPEIATHYDTGGDYGSAARFFYCAKASKSDRDSGNTHPTVKPNKLMRYLVRLVTPPKGVCADIFMGSGSTGKAAMLEGFKFVGVEREAEYFEIAKARIEAAQAGQARLDLEPAA